MAHTHIRTNTNTNAHTHTYTQTHTNAHTCTYTYTRTYQERGITLDLGFSSFEVPMPEHILQAAPDYDKLQFTLVDCPGHASLIKTVCALSFALSLARFLSLSLFLFHTLSSGLFLCLSPPFTSPPLSLFLSRERVLPVYSFCVCVISCVCMCLFFTLTIDCQGDTSFWRASDK